MKYLSILLLILTSSSCDFRSSTPEDKISTHDLMTVADSISNLLSEFHYNPKELMRNEYLEIDEEMHNLAISAHTKQEFISRFNELWAEGPFSHVSLGIAERNANEMADFFDSLRVGSRGASLEWRDKTAILTVTTMTGLDTFERIVQAYQDIESNNTNTLIIDVRDNPGGIFAIIPLVSHILTTPYNAGIFTSKKWWENNTDEPNINDIVDLEPWQGWSLKSFWNDIQQEPLTRIQFEPMHPRFEGKIYVLVSQNSASATEFAVDALAYKENVTIIGETTAGEMLSQKMYDLPHGFQLSLPIAEYYSTRIGRIEGKGVTPDIVIDPSVAMDLAMFLINGNTLEDALAKARLEIGKKDVPIFGKEEIYLFGNMNDWGKKWNITPQFQYKGDGKYETTTAFNAGLYEFKIAPMNWSFDYGAVSDQENVVIGERMNLARIPGSNNLSINLDEKTSLTFTLDVSDEEAATLYVFEN